MGKVLFFSDHPKVSACKTGLEKMEGLNGREGEGWLRHLFRPGKLIRQENECGDYWDQTGNGMYIPEVSRACPGPRAPRCSE